jgi:hypothetical protein
MYSIMRFDKIKSWAAVGSKQSHNVRSFDVQNADPQKMKNNRYLVGDENIIDNMKKRIGNIKVRKNAILGYEFMMTATPEFFRKSSNIYGDYDEKKLIEYEAGALRFLEKTFGKENIISVVTHLDEATPHIHAIITPITNDNRLAAAAWTDGPQKLKLLQDSFANEFVGMGLKRGKEGSTANHERVKQHYNNINNISMPEIESPTVSPPPTLISGNSKREWANNETSKIIELQKPSIMPVSDMAAEYKKEKEKRNKIEEEAAKLKNKLETDRLRDIDLHLVMNILGYSQDTHDKNQYKTHAGRISINMDNGKSKFYNHDVGFGKGGAIDLVMHVENCKYNDALRILGGVIDTPKIIAAAAVRAQTEAAKALDELAPMPDPVDSTWHRVRDYLSQERKISLDIIDKLYIQGKLYSDKFANACFRYTSGAVELRGTMGFKFHGFRGKLSGGLMIILPKIKHDDNKKLALVEGAIDAMSYAELHPTHSVAAIGGKGNLKKAIEFLKSNEKGKTFEILIATDNEKMEMLEKAKFEFEFGKYYRHTPIGHDWNDDLSATKTEKNSSSSPVGKIEIDIAPR